MYTIYIKKKKKRENCTKGYKPSSAKTAPQPNFVSDVLRAAPLFRENTERLKKLAQNSTLLEVWQCNILGPSQHSHFPSYCLPIPIVTCACTCSSLSCCTEMCFTLHEFFSRRRSSSCSWQVWILFITSPSFPPQSTHTGTEWYSCTLNYCNWNQILSYTTLTVLCFIAKCYK